MIHILSKPPTSQQVQEMLESHGDFIKLAVDIRQGILAGGGEFHADCESALLEEGSRKEDIWGADWLPMKQEVRFGALINLRPKINPKMDIQDPEIRRQVEMAVRSIFQRPS